MDRIIEKKRWTPKKIAWISGGAALLVVVMYGLIFGQFRSKRDVESSRLVVSTVKRGEFQEFVPVSGTVIPIKTHFLDAIEGGRVDSVFLEAGSMVSKGDKILKLANTNLLLDIMYREAELFQQSNNLRNTKLAMAQADLEIRKQLLELRHEIKRQTRINESNKILRKKNLIPTREYEEARDQLDYLLNKLALTVETQKQDSVYRTVQISQLEASLVRMQDNLEVVKKNLENLVIKAPVSGQLTSLNAEIGESKTRGERLGRIDILDGFKARVAIDEHYITRVDHGQTGTFELSGQTYRLTVMKIYPEVLNGRFQVDMAFDEEPANIRRGQTLRIRLELGDLSEATLLSTGGFYRRTGGKWVFVVDESNKTAFKKHIHLGRENAHYHEVLGGLEPGDRVITSSYDSFGNVDQLVLKQ